MIWVESVATSKPLDAPHSHIERKSVLNYAGENTGTVDLEIFVYLNFRNKKFCVEKFL